MSTKNPYLDPDHVDPPTPGVVREEPFYRGIIRKRSNCCNAPIRETEGIVVEICTQCEQPNPPERRIHRSLK